MDKILIALDYSKNTMSVFEKGKELAQSLKAHVVLVHVLSDTTQYSYLNYSPILGFDETSDMDVVQSNTVKDVRLAAEQFLERYKDQLEGLEVTTVLQQGDFAEQIIKTGKDEGVDILVLGTRGRKGLDKLLIGSVAEKVLKKSEIPVFIVPVKNL